MSEEDGADEDFTPSKNKGGRPAKKPKVEPKTYAEMSIDELFATKAKLEKANINLKSKADTAIATAKAISKDIHNHSVNLTEVCIASFSMKYSQCFIANDSIT